MQDRQSVTVQGWPKLRLVSSIITLLLVGLYPVHVFADGEGNNLSGSDTTMSTTSVDTTTSPTNSASTETSPSDTQGPIPTSTDSTTNTQSDSSTTTVNNQTTSTAESGDASASESSTGGNATSGNATVIATALNILSSSTDVRNNNINTSVTNIASNSNNKDVVIDPTIASTESSNSPGAGTIEINSASVGTINNNINATATTGDATVADNIMGGNATSGNATAEADIVNITNSDINSGQYYIGVINIYGDFSGNILLSPDFVSQLLSQNPSLLSGSTEATNTVNQTINNTINATATSGKATLANNFLGGNATSGNATTSIDTFDLINSDIIGNDALLVFVNVLGTWEGVIIGAPAGSTTSMYGDNVSGDTEITSPSDRQMTLASSTNEVINNNINATATTGDATVADNIMGGNATSGNATVSVNLLNILNSDISLTGWFGVLFINVFGNWSGDFGVITPAVTTVVTSTDKDTTDVSGSISLGNSIAQDAYTIFDQSTIPTVVPGQVLGTTTAVSPLSRPVIRNVDHSSRAWWLPAAAGMILASASLALEQIIRRRQHRNSI